jgi:hypothetical protein
MDSPPGGASAGIRPQKGHEEAEMGVGHLEGFLAKLLLRLGEAFVEIVPGVGLIEQAENLTDEP